MAGEGGCVRHDYMVANQAIVRDVSLRHQKTVVADLCDAATAGGAAMNGDKFPNSSSTADYCPCFFARKFQILWWQSDRDKRVNVRLITDHGAPVNNTVRVNAHTIAQVDVITNGHVRTDVT